MPQILTVLLDYVEKRSMHYKHGWKIQIFGQDGAL